MCALSQFFSSFIHGKINAAYVKHDSRRENKKEEAPQRINKNIIYYISGFL